MKTYLRIPLQFLTLSALLAVMLGALVTGVYFYVEPGVPEAEELRNVTFQTPSRLDSRDGKLITEFGEQKREPVAYEDIPPLLVDAIVAAEDDRFFEHSGIDVLSTVRAVFNYVTRPGERVAGGSTITQQITRTTNVLSRDYSPVRKLKELLLAYRIEKEFEKEEILALYLNTYEFGHRSFGVLAAARTYFNKTLDELTLSEIAILAGIPYGPSIMNPYTSPENAALRRSYVLRRLRELGRIDERERQTALGEPILRRLFGRQSELEADYFAEVVRLELIRRFGERAVYEDGLVVTTTLDSRAQTAANAALRGAVDTYDRAHGYRGPIARVDLEALGAARAADEAEAAGEAGAADEAAAGSEPGAAGLAAPDDFAALDELLDDYPDIVGTKAAVVLAVGDEWADVYLLDLGLTRVGLDAVSWARSYINEDSVGPAPESVADVLAAGDVVRFRQDAAGALELAQLPDVNGALVSVDPRDSAVVALVGGYSFAQSTYNRATQSARQPGSSMKPFIYSAALEHGYTPASIILDLPITVYSPELEERWMPGNYEGVPNGLVPLRRALVHSMNLAAIRTVMDIGPRTMLPHLRKFGFGETALKTDATLALGSGGVSPTELAAAYAVFANGGYSVAPYFIDRIETAGGELLYDARLSVPIVCPELETDPGRARQATLIARESELFPRGPRCAERAISAQNAYLITDMLKDVIREGSGGRARALERSDVAGKTGTTDGPRDAWFAGFNADLVAVAWVGFDDERLLGSGAQGGRTAIPAWISYMEAVLAGIPEHALAVPPGIVEQRINPKSGLRAHDSNQSSSEWEIFDADNVPDYEPAPPTRGPLTPESGEPRSLFL
jgi:penicillin-binding protein 1A